MNTIRILDILSMKLILITKTNNDMQRGCRFILLNMISLAVMQEKSLRNAMAIHVGFLPLRLFIGFNISNRWVL